MAKHNDREAQCDGGTIDPNLGERSIDRHVNLPRSFRDKTIHDVWRRPEGPAPLLRRLEKEFELGHSAPDPLSNNELAKLLAFYDGEPMPEPLTIIVRRELRGERRARPGRKVGFTPAKQLEKTLLPFVYARAMRAAAWLRKRLIRTEERKMRWQRRDTVPSQTKLAMHFVRSRLPSTRDLDDITIANKLSAIKDPSEKKPRAKVAKR